MRCAVGAMPVEAIGPGAAAQEEKEEEVEAAKAAAKETARTRETVGAESMSGAGPLAARPTMKVSSAPA